MRRLLIIAVALIATTVQAASVTNPLAVNFCNTKVRVVADEWITLYQTCEALADYWNANPTLATLLPNVVLLSGATGASTAASTTFTDASGAFAATHVGHTLHLLSAGAGTCVAGDYEITARASATSITLASAPCSVSGSAITYSVGDTVVDGAATDGRQPIASTNAVNIITYCNSLITLMRQTSNAQLNGCAAVAVNGRSKL